MCSGLGAGVGWGGRVLQETGGVGGGQQPDRGDLPHPAAAANHLLPAAPALAHQRLRQPGAGKGEERRGWGGGWIFIICAPRVPPWCCSELPPAPAGDGRGRAVQRGRRPPAAAPEPLPVAAAALQHRRGAAGGAADPGGRGLRPQKLILLSFILLTREPSAACRGQALKEDFPLSHVISPFTNQERREGMLLNLLIPFVLTVGSGSKGKCCRMYGKN